MLQRMQACGQTVFGDVNHHSPINSEKKEHEQRMKQNKDL